MKGAVVLSAALLALAACKEGPSRAPEGLGRRVFEGPVRLLSPSPDGAWLAFLDGCTEASAPFLPPRTASCDLRVVSAGGGEVRRIARAVTNLPHSFAWAPGEAKLAALAAFEIPTASGTLVSWSGDGPVALGEGVTFHGFGPRGELGWVAGGRLALRLPGEEETRRPEGGDGIASFDLSPAGPSACGGEGGLRLLARRTHAGGGQIVGAGCALDELRVLDAGQGGEYGFSRDGAFAAWTVRGPAGNVLRVSAARGKVGATAVAKGAHGFAFAPEGGTLAFVADAAPGRQGNLHLTEPGKPARLLAREVGEFRWAREAPRLAWLEAYDPRVRSGTLGIGGPGASPRKVAANVSDFDLSRDGRHVAFLHHTTLGGYSVDLALAHEDAPEGAKPDTIARGVFGFSFSPDGRWLYYRTRCVRNAEACDLERVPASGLPEGSKPDVIAPGVKSFEFDPGEPGRLLVTWQRMDMAALDVGVWEGGRLVTVDTAVLPGSARFLGPASRRIAYAVVHPKRQGIWVADLPR